MTIETKNCGFAQRASMTTDEILEVRHNTFLSSSAHAFRKPLHVVKASMQWIWDKEGKRYLDAFGCIVVISVGHNHPRVKARLRAWMDGDGPQHTSVLYLCEPVADLARLLTSMTPTGLSRVFFTNSGSESNEMAILLARQHTKRFEIVALGHAYHGGTTGTLSLAGQGRWKWGGPGLSGIVHAGQPNCYRCPWGAKPCACALECADNIEETIRTSTSGAIAGIIVEPIQGAGGFIVPPDEYFRRAHAIAKKYGGVFISDEVQTGMGRTGQHWFGILHSGVVPDMITMAKGLGNGASIGAIVMTDAISESIDGKAHFSTFSGNPWTTLQAAETLRILEDEGVRAKATELGGIIREGLMEIQDTSRIVGDVRGRGLLIGVELVKDKKTKAYAPEEALDVMEQAKDRGVLIGKGGLHGNVLRVTPPMCITADDAASIVGVLRESIKATEKKMGY